MLGGPAFLKAMGTQFQTLKTMMEAMVTKVVVSECLADSSFNIGHALSSSYRKEVRRLILSSFMTVILLVNLFAAYAHNEKPRCTILYLLT